jgi:hypothetical protein
VSGGGRFGEGSDLQSLEDFGNLQASAPRSVAAGLVQGLHQIFVESLVKNTTEQDDPQVFFGSIQPSAIRVQPI